MNQYWCRGYYVDTVGPSRRTLNNYACFYSETLTKAPQQVWQTLKNFDYPLKQKNKRNVVNPTFLPSFTNAADRNRTGTGV